MPLKVLSKAQHPAQKQLVILEYSPDEDKDKEEVDERERESALKITFFASSDEYTFAFIDRSIIKWLLLSRTRNSTASGFRCATRTTTDESPGTMRLFFSPSRLSISKRWRKFGGARI